MSAKAVFTNREGKKIKILIKDTYPITGCKLKELPDYFMTKEQRGNIKKEIMPYDIFTP